MKKGLFAASLITLGALIVLLSSTLYFYKNFYQPNSTPTEVSIIQDPSLPIKLQISEIGLDVSVKAADTYNSSDYEAIFLKSSQNIGTGNSVVYAHNWDRLFGRLKRVKIGDGISVYLSNGDKVNYEVAQIHTVPAETLGILKKTTDSRLTLFTCTGFLDKDRLVVVAMQI